ncbi:MAG TPA: hypothetical protein PLV83_05055 [Bacilli bacterium]|nr:hypothetical protein [Bacilli bacterium]
MEKKHIIILIIIFLIVVSYIVIDQIKLRPKIELINDVKEIMNNIKDYKTSETIEIVINNEYEFNKKTYKVKGKGVIFLEDKPSIMLSRNGMCAMKLPYSEDIMFQKEECPNYRLINNKKIIVETK